MGILRCFTLSASYVISLDEPHSTCILTKLIHNFQFITVLINNKMETIFPSVSTSLYSFGWPQKVILSFSLHITHSHPHGLIIWYRAAKGFQWDDTLGCSPILTDSQWSFFKDTVSSHVLSSQRKSKRLCYITSSLVFEMLLLK